MSADQRKARELFLHAVGNLSPEQWEGYVTDACGGDADLAQQVGCLLQVHREAGSFLDAPASGLDATFNQPPVEHPGMKIGPYKLLQQIGEGGMGVVYMADQTEPVQRKVALKLIKPGMDSRQVIARFEAERQALAMMDHVNIARVLDVGATESGRPYFVMELVHGVPITKYCDDNRLTPRQRLELFVTVCQAIQHAHQKGIIHRDIKPSNVLVTLYDGQPVPKVIDFGVAKATEQKLTERTLFTQYGTMVGTLEYMSPEQAEMSALGVDTRSDIYSLGVLLYELLTGGTPLSHKRFKEAAYAEVLRMIKEEEPPKPSTRLSDSGEALASISANRHMEPAKLTKLVRGELDWIVMKTLEKDRNRRYETANGFAMDVQRYLADEPVQACPPSAGYRFRKLARRNKRALVSAAVLALAVLAVAGTLGWAVRDREAHAQGAARERAAREASIQAEVDLALKEAEQWQEQAKWPEALSAAKRAEGLLAGGGSDEVRERVHQFRTDLDMVLRLEEFRAQRQQHSFDNEALNGAYARLFADFGIDVESLSPPEVAARIARRPATAVRAAAALDEWAQVLRNWGLRDRTRDPATWKRLLEAARLADPDPWRSELRQLMGQEDLNALRKLSDASDMTKLPVQSLRLMGNALIFAGDDPACVAWLRKAHRQHPGDSLISFDLAFHLSQLPSADLVEVLRFAEAGLAAQPSPLMYDFVGNILSKLGRYDEAIELYRKAIELKPDYALGHINLGNALRQKGHLIEAIACYRKAIELSPKQSWVHNNLAAALDRQGKQDEATAAYREAIRLKADEELAAAERAEADWLRIVAAAGEDPAPWVQCGRFYAALGKQQQAAECFAEAIAPKSAKRPPLAAIPFSADEAVRLQRAWADHLGVPVEFENSLGMTFRLIPPGAFDMGTPPDVRQQIVEELRRQGVAEYLVRPHEEEGFVRVFLTAPYYLARCEVTVQQFRKFVEDTGYQTDGEKKGMGGFAHRNGKWVRDPSHLWKSPGEGWELHDDQPVVHISWNDAVAFCNWLSKRDDKPCTLPTEAQWEFACRGGSPTIFGAGDDPAVLADVAWTRETKQLDWTHANARPVGSKKPNPFGLHDMLGNAFEWCTDWYAPGPTGSIPLVDPLNSTATGRRVARGGAWYGRGLENRCGHRMGTAPSDPLDAARGFRIAIVGDLKRVASPTASPEQSTPTSK